MISRWHRLGLRQRLVLMLTLGGLFLSSFLAVGTYALAYRYLADQRERSAMRTAFADAAVVRDGLLTAGRPVNEVLGELSPGTTSAVVLHARNAWYSSSLTVFESDIPPAIRAGVEQGIPVKAWVRVQGRAVIVTGVPLPTVQAQFYEVAETRELRETLGTLRAVLVSLAVITAAAGAITGRWAAAHVTRPLNDIAAAAGRIAAGDLHTRLTPTDDPELAGIVGSFNAMVDTLDERIARDARFAADVSHELRTPLTALVTSVEVLRLRSRELPSGSRTLLEVVALELARFRHLLEDLIELARVDNGADLTDGWTASSLTAVVRHSLIDSGRPPGLLTASDDVSVLCEPRMLRRALVNLFDNADLHGRGLVAVGVTYQGGSATVTVDDHGPGVPEHERERVFARFARGTPRASTPGSGLGLSLVAEIARRHGGDVWCRDAPDGGARFALRLPVHSADATAPRSAGARRGPDSAPAPSGSARGRQ